MNNLFKEGKITTKYLNEKTERKPNHQNINTINPTGNSSNRKISDTSSLNNTNSIKKTSNIKKQSNANMIYHSHINDQNHLKANHKGDCCENCEDVFSSNKDKYRTKIKGQKIQEKNWCKR